MLSQHAGGNIFAHYPPELQAEFQQRKAAAANVDELWAQTLYWPFEMSLQGKSHLLREWFERARDSVAKREREDGAALAGDSIPWNRRLTLQVLHREAEAVLKKPR